tara:strand:+ start:1451 stop:1600 length:150 start_codon:yes stop_codon:yes gene_type:complete
MNNLDLLFSSKTNTLKFLQSKIEKSKIEKLFSFTIKEWNNDTENIFKLY